MFSRSRSQRDCGCWFDGCDRLDRSVSEVTMGVFIAVTDCFEAVLMAALL
jgi:hypothetical protein